MVRAHQQKLVAAKPHRKFIVCARGFNHLANMTKHVVAKTHPHLLVDLPYPIDINQQHRQTQVLTMGMSHHLGENFVEEPDRSDAHEVTFPDAKTHPATPSTQHHSRGQKKGSNRHQRSVVPDLIFEDEQHQRAIDLGHLLEHPECVAAETEIHRVTVFLTYRCNLACPYCKTIARSAEELVTRPQKAESHDLVSFEKFISSLRGTPIKHLHFTGGEAAINRQLPEMVRLCKQHHIECVSITSNGTLPPETYLALVDAGIDEIRISLDAADELLGRSLTLRKNAWASAVSTIRTLSEARDQGANFSLIINAVIGVANRHQLDQLVSFFISLAPDDIKLITEVDQRDHLGSFQAAHEKLSAVETLLSTYEQSCFPLLRRKLKTVFSVTSVGLESIQKNPSSPWRCYIPLTERTIDRTHYYPCSVYLRENGDPIGSLDDPQSVQREKLARFVREADCLTDPICSRYCLHCTREFNNVANQHRTKRLRGSSDVPPFNHRAHCRRTRPETVRNNSSTA